jgi:protein-disulfide isomerase
MPAGAYSSQRKQSALCWRAFGEKAQFLKSVAGTTNIQRSTYYRWSKAFLNAGKNGLTGKYAACSLYFDIKIWEREMNKKSKRCFAAVLLALAIAYKGLAQDEVSGMREEIEVLKQGQQTIRKELQEIKNMLLQRVPTPSAPSVNVRGIEFELGDGPLLGNDAVSLILIDITDYQCPYCARYSRETLPQILKQYVDSGKIRYAVLDFPLPMHQMASKAAEASHCAGDQGKYWEMHQRLMANQDSLDNLSSYAASLSLDLVRFEDCLKTSKHAEIVGKSAALAAKLGIKSVPVFILAQIDPNNPKKVKGIALIRGAQPFANFQKEIEQALTNLP